MDVAGIIQTIAISLPPLLMALTLHELAHGYVALRFGDETARWAGRLTLNPIKHMDPLGTFFILFGMITRAPVIGWAKPVPVNPHNLRRPHTDMIWVALAGPAMNLAPGCRRRRLALRWFPDPRWFADSSLACGHCRTSVRDAQGQSVDQRWVGDFQPVAGSTVGRRASAERRVTPSPGHYVSASSNPTDLSFFSCYS